jgi:hypothetical protein
MYPYYRLLFKTHIFAVVIQSKTIRDFDHHCTRHVGKYEVRFLLLSNMVVLINFTVSFFVSL